MLEPKRDSNAGRLHYEASLTVVNWSSSVRMIRRRRSRHRTVSSLRTADPGCEPQDDPTSEPYVLRHGRPRGGFMGSRPLPGLPREDSALVRATRRVENIPHLPSPPRRRVGPLDKRRCPRDTWVSEAIAVGGTLAGAVVGVCGSLVISNRQRANSINDGMRDAFGVYLGALYPAVAELRDMPDAGRPSAVARLQDRIRGETATFVVTRRGERATFGDRPRELAHRVAAAIADLQVLPLPADVRVAVDAANDYLERLGEHRNPKIKAEWADIHRQLAAAASVLGAS